MILPPPITIGVNFPGSDLDLVITTPSGRVLTPTSDIVTSFYDGATEEYYIVDSEEEGEWKIGIVGVEVNPGGDLQKNRVLAYTVFGGTFVEKYARDEHGRLQRDHRGHPIVKPFDLDCLVISSICLADIRNTSLHEVKDALQLTDAIQGSAVAYQENRTRNSDMLSNI